MLVKILLSYQFAWALIFTLLLVPFAYDLSRESLRILLLVDQS
jgi:hypothetical protein